MPAAAHSHDAVKPVPPQDSSHPADSDAPEALNNASQRPSAVGKAAHVDAVEDADRAGSSPSSGAGVFLLTVLSVTVAGAAGYFAYKYASSAALRS